MFIFRWQAHDSKVKIGISQKRKTNFVIEGPKKNMFSGCEISSRISKFFFSISATEWFSSSSSQTVFTFKVLWFHMQEYAHLERMGIYSKFYFVQTLRASLL
jgi:hypothetical protein